MSIKTTDLEKIFGTALTDINASTINGGTGWSVTGTSPSAVSVNGATQIRVTKGTGPVAIDAAGATTGAIIAGDFYAANSITGATTGDVVYYGGTGSDTISAGTANETIFFGKYDGADVVNNFNASTDKIALYENTLSDLKTAGNVSVSGSDLVIKTASNSSIKLTSAVGAASAVYLKDKSGNDLGILATSVAGGAGTITYDNAAAAKSSFANTIFVGSSDSVGGTLSFAGYTDDVDIYLDKTMNGNQIQGVSNLVGGSGNNILRGNADANLITGAGTGNILWGGKGADTLVGSGAVDEFYFGKTDGADSIGGFVATQDSLNLYDMKLSDLTVSVSGSDYQLKVGTGTSASTLNIVESADNQNKVITANTTEGTKKFVIADASVGGALTYVEGVDKYFGIKDAVLSGLDDTNMDIYLADTTKYDNVKDLVGGNGVNALRGNKLANTITAGAGESNILWGGAAGNDTLKGNTASADEFWYGATDGKDSIGTFDAAKDSLNLYSSKLSAFKVAGAAGADVTFTFDTNDVLTVNGIADNDVVSVTTSEGAKEIAIGNTSVSFASDVDKYYGLDAAGAVLAGATGTDAVDMDIYLADTDKYSGIVNITGGSAADNKLRGNSKNNIITAGGTDDTTSNILWGGAAGNDTLVGAAGAIDQFWYGAADGKDSISGFLATEDSLNLYNSKLSDVTVKYGDPDTITLTVKSGTILTSNVLTVDGSVLDSAITVGTSEGTKKVLVSSNGAATYDAAIDEYVNMSGALDGSAATTNMDIYLADTTKFTGTGVTQLIGGTGETNALRGNNLDNTITATSGSKNNILWGGAKGNDILQGTEGAADQFWFGKGDSKDTVQYSDSMDSVMLYTSGLTTTDVTAAISGGNLTLSIGTSDKLTIENWSVDGLNSFKFADGTSYSLSEDAKTWTKKA